MDALVSALVQTVLQNLSSVSLQEIGAAWGFKNELENLEGVFNTIQLVLKDAEVKQRKSQALHSWLQKLKSAAYDAENILDEVATEGLRRRVDSEGGNFRKLDVFFSLRNPVLFKLRISSKVKRIRQRLDAIADARLKFHLGEGLILDNQIGDMVGNRQTGSFVNELDIYGRNVEKEMIVEKLVRGNCDCSDLSIYAICGMGGIGKTTLAQLVYNDEGVEAHFDLRIWVCVSDDFSIQRLIRAIIESTGGSDCNIFELDTLQRRLQERLMGRRYLLVLDDVWNENPILWDGLKQTLGCGSNGSVVMVTSRIEKVAIMMATISTHHVQYLSMEDSWSVFSRRAFATGVAKEGYMEEIGKEIVKKCGGVPLAVKALGSLMRYKTSESEWLAIQSSEVWQLLDDENCVLPALRLSYDNLPSHLRQCFAYCCIFPKDYEMGEDHLIQLWMANGFITSAGKTDMYLTGRFIFKELVWRSFFQDLKKDFRGDVVCKMHDLMHDLAQSVMTNETCIMEHGKKMNFPKTLRHFSFDHVPYDAVFKNKDTLKVPNINSLRSFILHGLLFQPYAEDLSSFLLKQQYLRVLDFGSNSPEKLPNIICKLQHLKYLAMQCCNRKTLPESLTNLQNLQTLKLTSTDVLVELPKGMKNLTNLLFLEIEHCYSLVCTPPRLGELTRLQKLSTFIVGPDSAHQIDQLKDLNLGGKLNIRGLEYVRTFEDAKSANLLAKVNLTSLGLSWMKEIKEQNTKQFEEVLDGLQPSQNLEKLCIESYQGSSFPIWMSPVFFENLSEIDLGFCRKCERLPPFGNFPSLKSLRLSGMDSVKRLDAEWYGDCHGSFPALTRLIIHHMNNLQEWIVPASEGSFSCLTSLEIWGCPKLTGLPHLSTLKYLIISVDKNMALLTSITRLTSITSLNLMCTSGLDVLPKGLLGNHKALSFLYICSDSIKTLSNDLDNLSALHSLDLSCSNLESLPEDLKQLNSLESLEFSSCNSLVSIPATLLQGMSSLRKLWIQNCEKLKYPLSGTFSEVSNLQSLLINGCPELELLPESVQQLTALGSLRIWHCERLCSLPNWLGSLQSLSEMDIKHCKNLKSLPDSFQSLKSLQKFRIEGCPDLEKRCKEPEGVDWPKVAHIPNVQIKSYRNQHLKIKASKTKFSCI